MLLWVWPKQKRAITFGGGWQGNRTQEGPLCAFFDDRRRFSGLASPLRTTSDVSGLRVLSLCGIVWGERMKYNVTFVDVWTSLEITLSEKNAFASPTESGFFVSLKFWTCLKHKVSTLQAEILRSVSSGLFRGPCYINENKWTHFQMSTTSYC